jgi:hypothetical protein
VQLRRENERKVNMMKIKLSKTNEVCALSKAPTLMVGDLCSQDAGGKPKGWDQDFGTEAGKRSGHDFVTTK